MMRGVPIKAKILIIPINGNMQIKPLIGPTRLILKIGVQNYDWHELFPKGKLHFILHLASES
jgi:hypothetical protein